MKAILLLDKEYDITLLSFLGASGKNWNPIGFTCADEISVISATRAIIKTEQGRKVELFDVTITTIPNTSKEHYLFKIDFKNINL